MKHVLLAMAVLLVIVSFMSCTKNTEPMAGPAQENTVESTATATATTTATATATMVYSQGFEAGLDGWFSENATMQIAHVIDSGLARTGAGLISGTANITTHGEVVAEARANLRKAFNPAADVTDKIMSFNFWVPADLAPITPAYGTILWLYDTTWRKIYGPDLASAGWNQLTFAVPSTVTYTTVVSLQFYKKDAASANWSGNVYYDDFSW